MRALLLISHGSRLAISREENLRLAGILKERTGIPVVECAFLEAAEPSIPEGIDRCAAAGASEVVVLLNFLNSGNHVTRDIPAILETCASRHPGLRIVSTPPVGTHPGIADLFMDILRKLSANVQESGKP